ncbi:DUF1152 domain-containing protein [archaeon]|nr:DUF1152 domain-containing protein [archaeon]
MISLPKKYNKALILGTGGGNDIVSSVLPALHLLKEEIQVDIAGMLSPGAVHFYNGEQEKVINYLEGRVKRFVSSKELAQISFVDSELVNYSRFLQLPINKFYNLSTKSGAREFISEVQDLVKKNNYDLVLGVDVGGDILSRGKEDSRIFSPMMDFASLLLLKNLDVDTYLLEFGLGTDGELETRAVKEILEELRSKKLIISEEKINPCKELEIFKDVYSKVSFERKGNTIPLTFKSLEHSGSNLTVDHSYTKTIGGKKWAVNNKITLLEETLGKTYLINVKELANQRLHTAFSFDNVLEQFIRLKKIPTLKTELDLQYLWSNTDWKGSSREGFCLQILVPSLQLNAEMRKEMVQEGYQQMLKGMGDAVLVVNDDLKYLEKGTVEFRGGKYTLLSNKKSLEKELEKTSEKVESYQQF